MPISGSMPCELAQRAGTSRAHRGRRKDGEYRHPGAFFNAPRGIVSGQDFRVCRASQPILLIFVSPLSHFCTVLAATPSASASSACVFDRERRRARTWSGGGGVKLAGSLGMGLILADN